MQRTRQQAGFTLLELVVALAVSGLVTLLGASAMSMALDFYQRHGQRSSVRESIRASERILRHEWSGRGQLMASDGLSLEFVTAYPVLRKPQPGLELALVRYVCESAAGGGRALVHYAAPAPAEGRRALETPRWSETRVLATGVQACAFSFLTEVREPGGETRPRWLSQWKDPNHMPDLMRLALSGHDDMPAVVYPTRGGRREP